jgi:hypothetical protein
MKEKLILIIALLSVTIVRAQLNIDNLTLSNSTFGYFDPNYAHVACQGPVNLAIGSGNYEVIAGNEIKLCPGFQCSESIGSTGYFHAYVANQLLDFSVIEPSDPNNVGLYEKLELGISIPSLETRINSFLNDVSGQYKPGTNNYNVALNAGAILNPYDPQHISVDAVFFRPSSPNSNGIVRNAFFYRSYQRVGLPSGWAANYPNQIDPYEWRIRFGPDEIGTWNGYITLWVNGQQINQNFFFSFNVVANNEKGFVSVADNNQYLEYSNGEQFFPVGDNYCWPVKCTTGDCYAANCTQPQNKRIVPNEHLEYEKYIDRLSNYNMGGEGGNHSRLIFCPWGFEIEWEKLGNYDTRQIEMFELDEYIKYAESRGVYLSIASMLTAELNITADAWDVQSYWQSNPYNGGIISSNSVTIPYYDPNYNDPTYQFKGIFGILDPIDFLTDPIAKSIYKNKLRYMEARWGYSPNFTMHELLTEVDAISIDPDYYQDSQGWHQTNNYWNNPNTDILVENWMAEMASYTKNDLGAHSLTTLSYYGDGYATYAPGPINIWNDPNIDLIAGHSYFGRLDGLSLKANATKSQRLLYGKPCIYNESDIADFFILDLCNNQGMHNNVWSSSFSGSYGSGLIWEWRKSTIDDVYEANNQNGIGGMEVEYKAIRNFFSGIDLLNFSYEPYNSLIIPPTNQPTKFENFYMVRSDQKNAYGWFYNRSYNQYSQENINCNYVNTDPQSCLQQPYATIADLVNTSSYHQLNYYTLATSNYFQLFPNAFTPYPQTAGTFTLGSLLPNTSYTIEYYYTGGIYAGNFEPSYNYTFTTSSVGSFVITNAPPTGNGHPSDWAYVVHKSNEPRSSAAGPHKNESQNTVDKVTNMQDYTFAISPNPNSGTFNLSFESPLAISPTLYIIDLSGRILHTQSISLQEGLNQLEISKPELPAGAYFIKVDGFDEPIKMIISK